MTEPSKVMTDEEAGKILAEAWISDPIGLTLTRLQLEDEFRAEDAMTEPSKRAREIVERHCRAMIGSDAVIVADARQLYRDIDSAIGEERERCAVICDRHEQQAAVNETEYDSIGESFLIPQIRYWEGRRVEANQLAAAIRNPREEKV